MKQTIRISEQQLHNIIKESVQRIINENQLQEIGIERGNPKRYDYEVKIIKNQLGSNGFREEVYTSKFDDPEKAKDFAYRALNDQSHFSDCYAEIWNNANMKLVDRIK